MDTICKRVVGRREAESGQDIQTRIKPKTYQKNIVTDIAF